MEHHVDVGILRVAKDQHPLSGVGVGGVIEQPAGYAGAATAVIPRAPGGAARPQRARGPTLTVGQSKRPSASSTVAFRCTTLPPRIP